MSGDLFAWAHARLVRAAKAHPVANAGAATKRLRRYMTALLRAEVGR